MKIYNPEAEMKMLRQIVQWRISDHTGKNFDEAGEITLNGLPAFIASFSNLEFTYEESVILLISLMPHINPNFFDSIIQEYFPAGGELPEFGGVKTGNNRGMVPTGETALFILAGSDLEKKFEVQEMFSEDHFFYKQNILWLENVKEGEPEMSGRIILSKEWVDKLLYGKISRPKFSPEFPAKLISTKMEWADLVLHAQTVDQINDIKIWLEYNNELLEDKNISRKIKPGYRAFFYGPPGTGKTLTASLIGKQFQKDVYKVDLSQVISKYIG
ncbi:MAG: AAA family ATPase, partial [Chitinophagales bacterium]